MKLTVVVYTLATLYTQQPCVLNDLIFLRQRKEAERRDVKSEN